MSINSVQTLPTNWKRKKISQISVVKSSTRIHEKDWTKHGIPFFRAREIVALDEKRNIENPIYISREMYDEIKKNYPVPQKGDILVTGVGTIGVPYIVQDNAPFYFKDGNLIWISNFKDVTSEWIYFCLKYKPFIKEILTEVGSSVQTFTITQANNLELPLPPLPEQKKIAEILSTWDEAIELENQKIVFKKQYRDSFVKMMILRLEKKHKLTTTAQRIKSFLIESRDRVGNNDITPVAVGVNGIRLRTEIYSKELSSDYSNNKILRANDICFGIGTDQIVYGVLLSKNIYSVSPAYRVFNIVGIDPFYLKCYLDTKNTVYSKKYMIISARQGKSVNIKGLLNEMIIVPPLAVQQQFSKVVTEMDNEIQLLEKERDLLNTQKQGLMQRLLTGKVRVKLD